MDDQQPEKKRERKNANPNARQPPRKAAASRPDAVEARRRDLVQAAFEIIAEKGFEGLRTRDAATRAGVTVTTLHYYFDGKEALVQAVADYVKEQLIAVSGQASAAPGQSLFAPVLFQFREQPAIFIVLSEFHLRSLRDPELKPIMQDLDRAWRESIGAALDAGASQGSIRPGLDAPTAAATLVAVIKGMALQAASDPEGFSFERGCTLIETLLQP